MKNGTFELPVEQALDLASSLESGQSHRWHREGNGTSAWHWGVVKGNVIRIRPRAAGNPSPQNNGVVLEVRSAPYAEPDYLVTLLRSYLRIDDDIEAIYEDVAQDPRVAGMVQKYRALRLLRIEPWECLISFICSANSNLARIHANMEAVSEHFGEPVSLDGTVRYTFPLPERLAEAGEAALRAIGLGFRAPYVANAARMVTMGDLDLESLRSIPYSNAKERLMEVRGIGPKIADCVLLHSLDKLEAFPIDVWVRRAMTDWYFSGTKPPANSVMGEWALEHFGRYAGYAQLYLFHGRRLEGRERKAS